MTSLIETCLPTKHNMADKDGDSPNEDCKRQVQNCGHKLKGAEKDLQTIFKKLRVDSGPKRLHRKARLVALYNSRSGDDGSRKNVRQILREPVFTYKNQQPSTAFFRNQHTRRMRRRRRKMSLELRTDEVSELQRDSHSDSELECNKPLAAKVKSNASKQGKTEQRPSQSAELAVGCGRQHRRLQCATVQSMNFDDTTPEELASYFDQLLYFPKPMSAMAEMMYT